MMHGWGWNYGGGVVLVLLLAALGVGIFFLVRNLSRRSSENAQDILKERYAKGEITREEYSRMKSELHDS